MGTQNSRVNDYMNDWIMAGQLITLQYLSPNPSLLVSQCLHFPSKQQTNLYVNFYSHEYLSFLPIKTYKRIPTWPFFLNCFEFKLKDFANALPSNQFLSTLPITILCIQIMHIYTTPSHIYFLTIQLNTYIFLIFHSSF